MNATIRIQNPWPWAIVGWFAIFITAMAIWIVVAVRQRVDLVRPDYYAHEIDFQKQIERVRRTRALPSAVQLEFRAADRAWIVRLPAGAYGADTTGTLHLYRPSDAALDLVLPLALEADGTQTFQPGTLRPGPWKAQLLWRSGGSEYYHEQSVLVAEP